MIAAQEELGLSTVVTTQLRKTSMTVKATGGFSFGES